MTASGRRPLSRSALATANALRTRHGPILPSSVSQLPVMITREFERGGIKQGPSLAGPRVRIPFLQWRVRRELARL